MCVCVNVLLYSAWTFNPAIRVFQLFVENGEILLVQQGMSLTINNSTHAKSILSEDLTTAGVWLSPKAPEFEYTQVLDVVTENAFNGACRVLLCCQKMSCSSTWEYCIS